MSKSEEKVPFIQLLIIIAIVVLIIVIFKKINKKDDSKGQTIVQPPPVNPSSGGSTASSGLPKVGSNTILKRGTKAQEVEWLQHYYNVNVAPKFGREKLSKDGIFGPKTEEAVMFVLSEKTTTWNNFKSKVDTTINALSNMPSYWPNMF
jgi:hypothetical protein